MPARKVRITDKLDSLAALTPREREDREYEAKLAAFRAAIDEGDFSPVVDGDTVQRVLAALKAMSKAR